MKRTPAIFGALLCALFAAASISSASAQTAAPTKAPATRAKSVPKVPAKARAKPKSNEIQEIDWRGLLPEKERKKYSAKAPTAVHGPLGEGGPPAVQIVTTTVNEELDQSRVRMPGFIVPVGTPKDGIVREFFLVPYIGECIHVAPPPSNQMLYVQSATGVAAEAVHEAYWVTGKIRVETRTTPLGTAAYSLVAEKVEQYQY